MDNYRTRNAIVFGTAFWYLGAVFVKGVKNYPVFTEENQIYNLISAPFIAKFSIIVMKKLLAIENKAQLIYELSIFYTKIKKFLLWYRW